MKKWTEKLLKAEGYDIRNAEIRNVSLSSGVRLLKDMLLAWRLLCESWILLVATSTKV